MWSMQDKGLTSRLCTVYSVRIVPLQCQSKLSSLFFGRYLLGQGLCPKSLRILRCTESSMKLRTIILVRFVSSFSLFKQLIYSNSQADKAFPLFHIHTTAYSTSQLDKKYTKRYIQIPPSARSILVFHLTPAKYLWFLYLLPKPSSFRYSFSKLSVLLLQHR
jgi:hypothetical protein